MNEFEFLHPERWLCLLAPLVILLLAAFVRRRRDLALQSFADVSAHPLLLCDAGAYPRLRRDFFEILGLTLVAIACLEPAYGFTTIDVERKGVEIVVCLDTSRSMNANDLSPSRGERARRDVLALLPQLSGDRIALVAFAGDAKIICPLTHDISAYEVLLDQVNDKTTRRGGTNVGAALRSALALLPPDISQSQVICILSDGEDLEGKGKSEAARVKSRGIRIHSIGYGSARGAKVPGESPGQWIVDENGQEVISKMDAQGMRALAQSSGGEFLPADAIALPLVKLYQQRIRPMEQKRFESLKRRRRKSSFQAFLLPGLLCLLFAFVDRARYPSRRLEVLTDA